KPKEAEKPAEPVKQKEPEKPSKPAKPVVRTTPPPPPGEPQKRENAHRKTRMWRIIWAVAALLIVVLLVLLFVPTERLNILGDREGSEQQPSMETPATGPEISEPSAAGETEADGMGTGETGGDETTGPAVVEESPVARPEEEPPAREPAVAERYFLIAGSFRHLGYAGELEDQLKAMGYETDVMVTENRMYRVSVGGYTTKEEALENLERIRSSAGLESCWLLSNE
ncbi:MAG: SPOR domain-containing protein, partial [Bacteroidota bacterium]